MNLEDELRRSLQREPPSAGFAERVTARIAQEPASASRTPQRASAPVRVWFALAASLIVALGGGWMYERHRVRVEGERAAQQVEMALRITGETLAGVQQRLVALNERRRQREEVREGSLAGEPGRQQ